MIQNIFQYIKRFLLIIIPGANYLCYNNNYGVFAIIMPPKCIILVNMLLSICSLIHLFAIKTTAYLNLNLIHPIIYKINNINIKSLISVTPVISLPKDYTSLPYFFSFDVFSLLTYFFYIFSLFTYFLVPYIFYIITRYIIDKQYQKRFIIIFFCSSIIFFTMPLMLLITSIMISIPSLFFYLHYNFKYKIFNNIFALIISFLSSHGILTFLLKLYTRLFHEISDYQFMFLANNLFIFSLAYTVISRFYLLCVVTNNLSLFSLNNIILLNLTLFLCLFMWCLRITINLSFFIGSSKENLTLLFGEDIPPSSPSSQSSPQPSSPIPPSNNNNNIRNLSLWNRHTYYNYNSYARPRWYYIGNFTLGSCTLLLGCFGTYIAYQMLQTTIESNNAMNRNSDAMNRNSDAMNRQSDQADVEAGRMSAQTYIDKWVPKSK